MASKQSSSQEPRAEVPTLRQIGQIVGVSPSTVSAVLNNAPRARVYSRSTVERIRAAAEELGYFPNALASTLKRAKSGLIGAVVFSQQRLYHVPKLQAATERAREVGYELIAGDTTYKTVEIERCLQMLGGWRVEGLLLMTGGHPIEQSIIIILENTGTPYVQVGVRQPDSPCSGAVYDNFLAGRLLAKHLTALGHVKIGVLGGNPENPESAEWLRGIVSVLEESGVRLEDRCVIDRPGTGLELSAGYRFAGELLEREPNVTAIVCENDVLAIGAMRRVRECGREVPADISITGVGDICPAVAGEENRFCNYVSPGLTTIRTPLEEMGKAAVNMLVEMIRDEGDTKPQAILELSSRLIVRESTAPPKASQIRPSS